MSLKLLLALLFLPFLLNAQSLEEVQQRIQLQLTQLEQQKQTLLRQLEEVKFQKIQRDLDAVGLPSANVIRHSAMALEYSEPHEQARWVAHIILPDIIGGTEARSNDFRPDPKVSTGTAVEEDYFLKSRKPDSSWAYDGFGYDRGHLAPSADFRWSAKALSESYFYSNMSPQLAEFNRGGWAELENALRDYVQRHPEVQLYVVTGPILENSLPVIERSVNKVAIPKMYFKVALDLVNKRAIGFLMPNSTLAQSPVSYAVTIEEVQRATSLDFFHRLEDGLEAQLESQIDKAVWFPELAKGSVEPLYQPDLPRNHFNTVVGARYAGSGENIVVCGTVVGARASRTGNVWLNLDKPFPNTVFSIFIRKESLVNFSQDPEKQYTNQQVCFEGKVENFNGTPTITLEKEEKISLLAGKKNKN